VVNIDTRCVNRAFKPLLAAVFPVVIANSSAFAGEVIDLGANLTPRAIGNSGVVVGSSNTDQYPTIAFRWSADEPEYSLDKGEEKRVNLTG
jgi:hypothetical protein